MIHSNRTGVSRQGKAAAAAVLLVAMVVQVGVAQDGGGRGATDPLLDEISAAVEAAIEDVVEGTAERARTVIRDNTGIDLEKRGYGRDVEHERLPSGARAEVRRELAQLADEHDRELRALERELDRDLSKAQAEFEREARREDKVDKVREKRRRLQSKSDAAYAKFDTKVAELNRRYDEKRHAILAQERGVEQRGDRGRHGRETAAAARARAEERRGGGPPEWARGDERRSDAAAERARDLEQAREAAGADDARAAQEASKPRWYEFWK